MKQPKHFQSEKKTLRPAVDPAREVRGVRRRIVWVGVLFVALYLALVARAYYLQVHTAEQWLELATRQHNKKITLTAQRGTIYDRHGEALAVSLEADSIYVNPEELGAFLDEQLGRNKQALTRANGDALPVHTLQSVAAALADVLEEPYAEVLEKVQRHKKFIWVKRRITTAQSQRIKELDLPGVHSIREHKRFYPNGRVMGQILGFSGTDNNGLEGIERRYDGVLASDASYLIMQKDGGQRSIGSGQRVIKGRLGKDIYLTIDKQIQYIAEKELARAVAEAKAKTGSVVVLEPQSGQVLAMASFPDYDPNQYAEFATTARRNRSVCDTYEPGSTFKLFVLAAALDSKTVKPTQNIECGNGSYRVGGKVIHDHRPLGTLSVNDVLKFSSNIGCAKIAQALGKQPLYEYLSNFGFARKTEIDFDGEGSGLLRQPQRWFEIDLAAISFGQGLTVTPLQLATAVAAIANGGELYRPYLVQRISDPHHGSEDQREPRFVRRVIRREVADSLKEMMTSVTDSDGTGALARVAGFDVGGKTGTAQKVDRVTGTYSVDKYVVSFVGFAPLHDPKLVVLVVLDEPKVDKTYGGVLAAPVFSRIVEQSLRHLHIPTTHQLPVTAKAVTTTAAEVPALRPIAARMVAGTESMPDCLGLSSRQILQLMEKSGLNIMIKGAGRVVEQFPVAGQAIAADSPIWVRLQPPH